MYVVSLTENAQQLRLRASVKLNLIQSRRPPAIIIAQLHDVMSESYAECHVNRMPIKPYSTKDIKWLIEDYCPTESHKHTHIPSPHEDQQPRSRCNIQNLIWRSCWPSLNNYPGRESELLFAKFKIWFTNMQNSLIRKSDSIFSPSPDPELS